MKKIPSLDLKRQIAPIREELDSAIKEVIDEGIFLFGQQIKDFEEEVTKYCRIKYAIGVSNGSDAIRLALLACGIKPDDRVLCPAFTFYATAGAIAAIGGVPMFVDIDPFTYNISPEKILEVIKKQKKTKIKAIIPVHLYGQCAEMDSISTIAKKFGLKVIEDAAQAFGAEYKGEKAGTMGDCGTLSFFPGKNLGAFGDAGMVLTNSKIIANKLGMLKNQGQKEKYRHTMIGFNNRMDVLQATVLKIKLKYYDSWNRKRQLNAEYYNRHLSRLGLITPSVAQYNKHIYHQYVLRLPTLNSKLIKHLVKKGIDARVFYPIPLHLQRCFKFLGYKKGDFPESEEAAKRTVAIPVYPDLTKRELDYIIASIKEFYK